MPFQEGFKEGISDGRENEFQSGFDLGFTDGIRMGYALGQQIALKELNPSIETPVTKLPCESCKTAVDSNSRLENISSINRDSAKSLEDQVHHLLPTENKDPAA